MFVASTNTLNFLFQAAVFTFLQLSILALLNLHLRHKNLRKEISQPRLNAACIVNPFAVASAF